MSDETPDASSDTVVDDPAEDASPEVDLDDAHEAFERVEELESQLEATEAEADDLRERLQRLQARFQNFRKRKEREAEAARREGRDAVLVELLDVIDNFDRAIRDGREGDGAVEGLELLRKQLSNLLGREGVERVDPEGERFDPTLHEAVLREETDEAEEGTVLQVLQPGYRREGAVLRPARVKVATDPSGEA